ncbi:MAG: hypothetical protein A2365_02295 [Candidatus Nealsonbacteria bacterium RIFOXYB1_FULL_40_15]|uniref:Transcription elongation factor GreA n=2 Tax=Candidatus Nealsoniibacteriota TaxID=1817911 RepID=A0A1G2EQB6_9BACT|nr:MAG: hypothetical protein A2365_02295 [Candidatus Nealsonbacteria bacterium RIFOXYB1_FULL_40_15]OGZ27995.1 MAG: hypothetical protein A2427_01370 [Candidatus Nealsonbacteria bacterium RIFOXYC1_FULL_40_7]OGZ28486.1 MAG: hypothetical protein A2562_03385 [Candidatus Nealsonbacteria bacterium RIFOXYD1_FULL_39_11]
MEKKERFYLTEEGLEKIKKEYEILKQIRMGKTHEEAPNMLESQDLNPEYLSFREDLELLETRLLDLEEIIKDAVIIKKPIQTDFIDLGAKVTVDIGGEKDEFIIVGTLEASPEAGKISNESPVGRALIGKKVGEKITVSSPAKTTYKILDIKYS